MFVDVLKVIKRHHLEKLLQNVSIGAHILFEHHLTRWRESIGVPMMEPHQCCSTWQTNAEPPSPSSSAISISTSTRSMPYDRPSTPDLSNEVTLAKILNDSVKGIMICEFYKKYSKFDDDQRSQLIYILAHYFDEKNISLSLSTSYRLEREILERFPTEKIVRYFTGYFLFLI